MAEERDRSVLGGTRCNVEKVAMFGVEIRSPSGEQ